MIFFRAITNLSIIFSSAVQFVQYICLLIRLRNLFFWQWSYQESWLWYLSNNFCWNSFNTAFSFFHLQVKQLLENDDKERVIATCRNPSASTGLIHLKDKFEDRLRILPLDLTVESSIEVMLPFPILFSFSFAPTKSYL